MFTASIVSDQSGSEPLPEQAPVQEKRAQWLSPTAPVARHPAEESESDSRDTRRPVAEGATRTAALEQRGSQVVGQGARLRDVLRGDPDRAAVGCGRAIVTPARPAAAEERNTGKAVPRTRTRRGDMDIAGTQLRIQSGKAGTRIVVGANHGERDDATPALR